MHPPSIASPRLAGASQLRPGTPAAPESDCLPLLPSRPGGVHRLSPRRTRASTPLDLGSPEKIEPRVGIRPCCSGLQVQGTASSPSSTAMFNCISSGLVVSSNIRRQPERLNGPMVRLSVLAGGDVHDLERLDFRARWRRLAENAPNWH